jgi:hypothetical protein
MPGQAERGGGRIAPTHSKPGSRRWVVSTTLRLLYSQERPIIQKAGCASGPVWTAQKISPPLGFNPTRSESLYRVSNPRQPVGMSAITY